MDEQFTSLELSKKLEEAGCVLPSRYMWTKYSLWKEPKLMESDIDIDLSISILSGQREYEYRAYDLLWEVGIKYGKEFWGDEKYPQTNIFKFRAHVQGILSRIQQGKIVGAEKYILKHSIFFKK